MEKDNKKPKKFKIAFIFSLIFLIISLLINIILIVKQNKKEIEYFTTLTYQSIAIRKNEVYANFKITTNQKFTIYSSDFTVLKNNIPYRATGLIEGTSSTFGPGGLNSTILISTYQTIYNNGNIYIQMGITEDEINENTKFLYRGIELPLGQEIKFKI